MAAEIRWIKVLTDIFEDEKIKLIKSMPEGRTLVLLWFQLLMQAGKTNAGGWIFLNEETPYTSQNLSVLFSESQQMIDLAIQVFASKSFEMIEIDHIGRIYIPNWEKHQAVDSMDKIKEQNRLRKAREREKKQLTSFIMSRDRHGDVTPSHATDIELELDIDKEKEKDIVPPQFNEFWTLYPRKGAKEDAISAWKTLLKNKTNIQEVLQATKNYAILCKGKEMEFIKLPATFLRKDRWKDSLTTDLPKFAGGNDQRDQDAAQAEAFREWVRAGNDPDRFIYTD